MYKTTDLEDLIKIVGEYNYIVYHFYGTVSR